MTTITLNKFRYVLDWYETSNVEIDTEKFAYFYLEFRLGSWYLCHYARVNSDEKSCKGCGNYWVHAYQHDFELSDPIDAVLKLGNKLKGYRSLHNNTHFPKTLADMLNRVEERRLRNKREQEK